MKRSQNKRIRYHKLPSKVTELLTIAEKTTLVGFGATPEQQYFMLFTAVFSMKTPDFQHKLNKELSDYFLTLSESLSVDCTNIADRSQFSRCD